MVKGWPLCDIEVDYQLLRSSMADPPVAGVQLPRTVASTAICDTSGVGTRTATVCRAAHRGGGQVPGPSTIAAGLRHERTRRCGPGLVATAGFTPRGGVSVDTSRQDGDDVGDTVIISIIERPAVMPTHVLLTTFTQQGIEHVRNSPERTDHAKELVELLGGTWQAFFVTMGRYDGAVIADFPDDATVARAVLALAESGNVTTETLRAFTLEEFREIVEAMP